MRLDKIPKSYIADSIKYADGDIIVLDSFMLPYNNISFAEEAVLFFDKEQNLKWIVNGVKKQEFWQETGDCFTGCFLYDNKPVLSTFSGHLFNVNIENGEISFLGMSK